MTGTMLRGRPLAPLALVALAVVAVLAALALGFGGSVSASQEPRVLLTGGNARIGEEVTLTLSASHVTNLAGFQANVGYDAAGLEIARAELQQGLKASGRDMFTLGPVGTDGMLTLGAATCPASSCTAAQPWRATKKTAGVDGDVALATLTFTAEQAGRYEITLNDVVLVDPQGNQLPATTVNAVVDVAN